MLRSSVLSTFQSLERWSYPLLVAGWLDFLIRPTVLTNRSPYFSLFSFMRRGVMGYHSELWRRLGSHSLVVFSTHIPAHVAHIADRVVVLNEGRVCYAGETEAPRQCA
jgi:ABC-type molybdate transport system ATPase subunit